MDFSLLRCVVYDADPNIDSTDQVFSLPRNQLLFNPIIQTYRCDAIDFEATSSLFTNKRQHEHIYISIE